MVFRGEAGAEKGDGMMNQNDSGAGEQVCHPETSDSDDYQSVWHTHDCSGA